MGSNILTIGTLSTCLSGCPSYGDLLSQYARTSPLTLSVSNSFYSYILQPASRNLSIRIRKRAFLGLRGVRNRLARVERVLGPGFWTDLTKEKYRGACLKSMRHLCVRRQWHRPAIEEVHAAELCKTPTSLLVLEPFPESFNTCP